MKIAKLASNDVVNPHQAYGQHRIIGSILAQKDVTLNFKLFVWKSETRWLSAILVNNALGKGSSFIPIHPATSPKNDYYLLFNTETKIDFINLRYAKLGKNWQPNDSEELQPFKDSWPSIENVEEPPKTFSLKIFSNGK